MARIRLKDNDYIDAPDSILDQIQGFVEQEGLATGDEARKLALIPIRAAHDPEYFRKVASAADNGTWSPIFVDLANQVKKMSPAQDATGMQGAPAMQPAAPPAPKPQTNPFMARAMGGSYG